MPTIQDNFSFPLIAMSWEETSPMVFFMERTKLHQPTISFIKIQLLSPGGTSSQPYSNTPWLELNNLTLKLRLKSISTPKMPTMSLISVDVQPFLSLTKSIASKAPTFLTLAIKWLTLLLPGSITIKENMFT